MSDSLCDRDILVWSEQQVALLRQLATGERPNAAVDWPNVIEELEAVGRSELRSCESLLIQALAYLLKLSAWPGSAAVNHWRGETASFLTGARRSFTPSMRQRIDLADLYADALYEARATTDDSGEPRPLPKACPFVLDDLLAGRPDIAALAVKLAGP